MLGGSLDQGQHPGRFAVVVGNGESVSAPLPSTYPPTRAGFVVNCLSSAGGRSSARICGASAVRKSEAPNGLPGIGRLIHPRVPPGVPMSFTVTISLARIGAD